MAAVRGAPGVETLPRRADARAARGRGEAGPRCAAQDVELRRPSRPGARRVDRALRAGLVDDPRGHLHHAAEPEPPVVAKRRASGEAWAALSVGLLIASLAVVVWFRILPPVVAIVVLFGVYLAIESFFRKDMRQPAPAG